tara:strand:- start:1825 stop:2259 length:435 start_codon:yes stop_codon:yes gene_type:complete
MEKTIRRIIKKVCEDLDMYSKDAEDLIIATGYAESGYRALEQTKGPAVGFFQIEPDTIDDVLDNYARYRPAVMQELLNLGMIQGEEHFSVMSNIALQVAFCRLCYRRVPEPIPPKLKGMADYWKKYYNTPGGKGTVKHFLEANK